MDKEIAIELIRLIPTLLLMIIILLVIVFFHKQLFSLLSKITKIGFLGVQAEFIEARDQLHGAVKNREIVKTSGREVVRVSDADLDAVIRRADRLRDILFGSRVLWVDDEPIANASLHRFLNSYGVIVDNAYSTEEALPGLFWLANAYEVVVSDMMRGGDGDAGLKLLEAMKQKKIDKPLIFFVGQLDESLGIPPGARTITNRPDKLLHHIMDVIERERA